MRKTRDLEIRRAKPEDYERVRDLVVSEGLTTSKFFTKERFVSAVKRFGKYYLAAEKDGEVIGFVSGFDDTGIFYGYMGRLVVDARYRRIGIGRELTKACLEEFRKSGVAVVFAGVKNGNIASLELLAKEGFLDDGYKLLRKIYI